MFIEKTIFLLLLISYSYQQTSNYCDRALCPPGKTHIACGASLSKFAPACGSNAFMVAMNTTNKAQIVDLHNQYRNKIALGMQNYTSGGKTKFYPQAARMATIQWNEELANIAAANARRCIFEHDECRNTAQLKAVGQNLAWISYYGKTRTDASLIEQMIGNWFGEYVDASAEIINKYPKNYKGPAIGHFTNLVADRANKVGCAMISFVDGRWLRKYLVCDYSITNIVGQPIYKAGLFALECSTGVNKDYPALCSLDEKVDSNP